MMRVVKILSQGVFYAGLAVLIGYFSVAPRYQYAPEDVAVVKLALTHAAERVTPCVQFTPEEIAAMPPNERQPGKCERERVPLTVELEVDGELLVSLEARPAGLWNDGPASVYERFNVEPGKHRFTARLRDSDRESGWDYTHTEEVDLTAGRYFTVTFRAGTGGFSFQ
jgi:hypothetical protein